MKVFQEQTSYISLCLLWLLALVPLSQAGINHVSVYKYVSVPASSTFTLYPGLELTQTFSKPQTVFVYYQITGGITGRVSTMLQVNGDPVSMATVSNQEYYRSSIGFWAKVVTPGSYKFRVLYKSTGSFVASNGDWATNTMRVFWMDYPDSDIASSHLSCDESFNTNNFWKSLDSSTASLLVPEQRAVLSMYTSSFYFPSTVTGEMFTQLEVDGCPDSTSACSKGLVTHTNLFGGEARMMSAGLHQFRFRTRATHDMTPSFCGTPYGQNLAALVLPRGCKVDKVCPESPFSLNANNGWTDIPDMSYSLHTSKTTDVIVMYQLSSSSSSSHIVTRLLLNGNAQRDSSTITGNTKYAGNFNLWYSRLETGHHYLNVQLRSPAVINHNPIDSKCDSCGWESRCLTVIHCPL